MKVIISSRQPRATTSLTLKRLAKNPSKRHLSVKKKIVFQLGVQAVAIIVKTLFHLLLKLRLSQKSNSRLSDKFYPQCHKKKQQKKKPNLQLQKLLKFLKAFKK